MFKKKVALDPSICPKCQSEDYKVMSKGAMLITLLFLASGTFIIGLLIWPLLIFSVGLLLMLPILMFTSEMNQCNKCNKTWKVKKSKKTKNIQQAS